MIETADGEWVEHPGPCEPGDLFYVRECHRSWFPVDDEGQPVDAWHVRHRADGSELVTDVDWDEVPQQLSPQEAGCDAEPAKWSPSIHHPKALSRIWLRALDVRPERLQDITEEDAVAEGWEGPHWEDGRRISLSDVRPMDAPIGTGVAVESIGHRMDFTARGWFVGLWDRLYARRGYPWADNPWVWRTEFEVASVTGRDNVR